MTKIKKFRVTLRPREVARWLKKEKGMEITPDLELEIESQIKEARWLAPAAVYTTLTRQTAEKTTPVSFPDQSVALSITAVSIGPVPEDSSAMLQALVHEALSQTVQFVTRLITEQAKEEDCEMSAPESVQDPTLAATLATLVGVNRIGITVDASHPVLPSYSRVCHSFWTPVGKGSPRRAESAGRVEKVAV